MIKIYSSKNCIKVYQEHKLFSYRPRILEISPFLLHVNPPYPPFTWEIIKTSANPPETENSQVIYWVCLKIYFRRPSLPQLVLPDSYSFLFDANHNKYKWHRSICLQRFYPSNRKISIAGRKSFNLFNIKNFFLAPTTSDIANTMPPA